MNIHSFYASSSIAPAQMDFVWILMVSHNFVCRAVKARRGPLRATAVISVPRQPLSAPAARLLPLRAEGELELRLLSRIFLC